MPASHDVIAGEILDIVPTIMRVIRAEMQYQRSEDLSVPQFRTLLFISRKPGSSLLTVANHLGLTSPTVSTMVEGLVLKKLIMREISSEDRRKVTLMLTDQGGLVLEKVRYGTQIRLSEILSPLTQQEREMLLQSLYFLRPLFISGTDNLKKNSKEKQL
jgi:DNA-binding MarR family transcriptional regulator